MIKILVLGANGLLGHLMLNHFSCFNNFDVHGTVRKECIKNTLIKNNNLDKSKIHILDLINEKKAINLFKNFKFDYVINCTSINKSKNFTPSEIEFKNIYLEIPRLIFNLSKDNKFKFINISSDGVFSGRKGNYSELDIPDSKDFYGKYKILAEEISNQILTIRTSIIGHQLSSKNSLLEWFINSKNNVDGYSKVTYSGLTALEFSKILRLIIEFPQNAVGLFNLSGPVISKYELLNIIKNIYKLDLNIRINKSIVIDRSLNDNKIRSFTSIHKTSWKKMIKEMKLNPHGFNR